MDSWDLMHQLDLFLSSVLVEEHWKKKEEERFNNLRDNIVCQQNND